MGVMFHIMNYLLMFLSLTLSVKSVSGRQDEHSAEVDSIDLKPRFRGQDPHEDGYGSYPHVKSYGGEGSKDAPSSPLVTDPEQSHRIFPLAFGGRHMSPLVAASGPYGDGDVMVAHSVVDGSDMGSMGIYTPPAEDTGNRPRGRVVSLHQLIHRAKDEALKAKAKSSAAEVRRTELLALNQGIHAKLRSNEAKMLEEEEQRLVAQRSNPQILVKDTIPIANVANNSLSFEHHNELLRKKLEMINNDQNNAVKRAAEYARLHKARSHIAPDSLITSNPDQFNDFVKSGPVSDLSFEVPVDPSSGNFYVSGNSGEGSGEGAGLETMGGEVPYFVAHKDDTHSDDTDPLDNVSHISENGAKLPL